jgi:hypothetical protein
LPVNSLRGHFWAKILLPSRGSFGSLAWPSGRPRRSIRWADTTALLTAKRTTGRALGQASSGWAVQGRTIRNAPRDPFTVPNAQGGLPRAPRGLQPSYRNAQGRGGPGAWPRIRWICIASADGLPHPDTAPKNDGSRPRVVSQIRAGLNVFATGIG